MKSQRRPWQRSTCATKAARQRFLPGITLLLALSLCCGQTALAKTSLWKISLGEKSLYLGGTIHVLRPGDYPLPDAFGLAFEQADILGLETDMSRVNSFEYQQTLLSQARYENGDNLANHLNAEALTALEDYCKNAGIPLEMLLAFKPAMSMMTILALELQHLGIQATGVDNYFMELAVAEGKPVIQLETPEQQLAFILDLGVGQESDFILHIIDEIQQVEAMLAQMIAAWREGDTDSLDALFVQPLAGDYPRIYQSLLVDRNQAWLPHIEEMLQTDPTELLLVGAAHLVGEDGLLASLKRRGYTIEQF